MLNRDEKLKVNPGYDGVYGELVFDEKKEEKTIKKSEQRRLSDF